MKRYFGIMIFALIVSASIVYASDFAIYSGPSNPDWISAGAVKKNTETVMNHAGVKGLFNSIENFGDGDEKGDGSPLAKWCIDHTGNGQQDVILLACGTAPSALYPFPNAKPDGSNVENFIEAGNVVINVADWIFYMSYEGGVRSADNGPGGAANVFDIPGLTFNERGTGNQVPTELGEKYIPSLKAFRSIRPWHVEQFANTNWDVVVFAQENADNADPAVAISKEKGKDGFGMIAAMWQMATPNWAGTDPRGIGVAEFIENWLAENASLDVHAKNKLSTTWGHIKQGR
ncbi:hypothetical protein F4212_05925 [Candidatus Poribacteria bacterium]|nr:hypothetical protein [Candidatus Poribacteria bacterium]